MLSDAEKTLLSALLNTHSACDVVRALALCIDNRASAELRLTKRECLRHDATKLFAFSHTLWQR